MIEREQFCLFVEKPDGYHRWDGKSIGVIKKAMPQEVLIEPESPDEITFSGYAQQAQDECEARAERVAERVLS